MNLEQSNLQFNIENLKNNFKKVLDEYILKMDDLNHIIEYEMNDVDEKIERKKLKTEMDKSMNQLISIIMNSIRLTKDKQEILDVISTSFNEIKKELNGTAELRSIDWTEKEFLKKIILELVKM